MSEIDTLLEGLLRSLPCRRAHVLLLPDEGAGALRHWQWSRKGPPLRSDGQDLVRRPAVRRALRDARTVAARGLLVVPLRAGGDTLGLCAAEGRAFDRAHRRLAETLAGAAAAAIAAGRDARRQERRAEDLGLQVAEYRRLLDVLPVGVAIARDPDCAHVEANACLAELLGIARDANASLSAPPGEAPPGIAYRQDGRQVPPSELPMQRAARTGLEVSGTELDLVRDGVHVATILGHAAPLLDERGRPRGAIGAAIDITERKRAERRLAELAYQDELTRLPNRRLFTDRLSVELARAARHGCRLAVLFLDVDGFKLVNDSLGHSAGDRLLQAVADRLRSCVRGGDTVARLGGDEFIVLAPDIAHPEDAARVADKLVSAMRRPLDVDGREMFVTASVGISLFPDDGDEAETLVRNADAAMYRAKERGHDGYQLYAPGMTAAAMDRLALESSLRRAVAHGELEVWFQPVLEVGGRVHGLEALLRWRHGARVVSPADFVPLAESTGLIHQIAPWVLRQACREALRWDEQGFPGLAVAVNLSPRQFQRPELVDEVAAALRESGLSPGRLDLEITESGAMESAEAAMGAFRALKALGVRLTIDDFGTGYSSLGYLRRFPLDALKVDRSFVADLASDPEDAAIVSAILGLARTLRLVVVGEGVESPEQLAYLAARGCDRVQGHLFSPAVPAADVPGVLRRLARAE